METATKTEKRSVIIEFNLQKGIACIETKGEVRKHICSIFEVASVKQESATGSDFEIKNGIYNLKNKDNQLMAVIWDAELEIVS